MEYDIKEMLNQYSLKEIVQNMEPDKADDFLTEVLKLVKPVKHYFYVSTGDASDLLAQDSQCLYCGFNSEGILYVREETLTFGTMHDDAMDYSTDATDEMITFEEAEVALRNLFIEENKVR